MATFCCTGVAVQKTVGSDLDQQQNWLLSVPSSPSMLGLGRQICDHAEVDSKSICTKKRCGRDVGHQMATFCYTGATVQMRLAVTSISSRTGCCLYGLAHQCSDWGAKPIIMQRSTHNPVVPTKNLTATLGYQMATFCYTGAAVQKRLAVTSINNRTGCCLHRLAHQYSDWGGKSVTMQKLTQKNLYQRKM